MVEGFLLDRRLLFSYLLHSNTASRVLRPTYASRSVDMRIGSHSREGGAHGNHQHRGWCFVFHPPDPALFSIHLTQGYAMSASVEAAPGDVVSETEHATTYQGATAATFEGENAAKIGICRTSSKLNMSVTEGSPVQTTHLDSWYRLGFIANCFRYGKWLGSIPLCWSMGIDQRYKRFCGR